MKKMKIRYTVCAVCLVICLAVLVLGFVFKPEASLENVPTFQNDTSVDKLVKSEVALISPLFAQDILDDNGNVSGEMYHILAADVNAHRFILSAPKEYYEANLTKLEDNLTQDLESGNVEILDPDNYVEVYGYSREMSPNLTAQLDNYLKGYESVLFKYSLELVENPEVIKPLNMFFTASGIIGVIAAFVLLTAVSATAEYSRKKEKLEKRIAKAKSKANNNN